MYSCPLMDYMGEACLKNSMVWPKNRITRFHIQDSELFRSWGGERLCFLYGSKCGHNGAQMSGQYNYSSYHTGLSSTNALNVSPLITHLPQSKHLHMTINRVQTHLTLTTSSLVPVPTQRSYLADLIPTQLTMALPWFSTKRNG